MINIYIGVRLRFKQLIKMAKGQITISYHNEEMRQKIIAFLKSIKACWTDKEG